VSANLSGAADKQFAVVHQQRAHGRRDTAQRLDARAVRASREVQTAIVAARILCDV
jgi:hypothetical protein